MVDREKIIEIFKASPTPTSILKANPPNFTFIQVNEAYMEMTQRKEEDLLGKSLFKSFPENPAEEKPTGVEKLKCSFQKVIQSKEPDEMDAIRYDIVLDGGQYRKEYWKVINTPIFDDDGQVEFIINTATNITKQVLSERANKLMLNNSEDSFIFIDRQLVIQSFNDLFAHNYKEIFDVEVKEGESILNYAQPERRETVKKIYTRVFEGESIENELPFKTEAGQTRYFNIKYKPAKDENGNIIGSFISLLEKTDEYKAKLELEKREARFRALVENGGDVVFILSPEGKPTYISPSIENVLGYSLEEALKMDLFDKVHPDDVAHVKRELTECLEKPGEPLSVTPARMKHKDGSWHWFEGTITNMIHDPAIGGIVDNFHDVTERIEVENKYRNVVVHSTNMFYQHDTDGVLTYVSPQSKEFLGYPPEKAMKKWMEFVTDHPANKKGEKLTKKAIETGEVQPPYELQLKKADGDLIWVEIHETPIKENGEVVGIAGSLTDITDRKRYEEQLKESLQRYDYVSKATRDAIYDWNITENTIHWGEGFKNLFGHEIPEETFPIEKWAELVHPNDIKDTMEDMESTLGDSSQNSWTYEYRFLKSDGSFVHVVENGYIIRDEDENALRMIGALRDITESKQIDIQNKLQQDVAQYFKKEESLPTILENVLQHLTNFGKFSIAEIWLTNHDKSHFNLISTYGKDKAGKNFYKYSNNIEQFTYGEGLPGTIWKNQQIENWNLGDAENLFTRKNAAQKAGLTSAFGLPLIHNDEVIGVLLLGSQESAEDNSSDICLYEVLQSFMGGEIKRKQQEEEMRLLFESAPEILAVASPNGYFSKVNPAFCELMGYTEEELTSQPFENFLHPDDRESTITEYSETITGERQANNFVNRYKTKSGEFRWISWSSSDVFGEDDFVFAFGRDVTETKELEKLLNEVQHMAKIGAWELDLKNETLYWSPITKNIHEVEPDYNPELENGINFYKEGENREKIQKALDKAIEEGEAWDEELKIVSAKGSEKWVRVKGQPEFVNGECRRIYGSFQDIHDRKETQIKLFDALAEQKRILERINEAFFAVDENWTVTYWNKKAEEVIGVPQEEVIGKNLWEKFPEAKEQKFFQEYDRAFKEQVSVSFEEYYAPLNIWLELNAYPSKDGLSVFFRDITDKKSVEEKIKQTNEKLKAAQKIAKLGYWEFDLETEEVYWSQQAYDIWEYDPEEVSIDLNTILERMHPDDRKKFKKENEKTLQEKVPLDVEHRILLPDGSVKWLQVSANIVKGENGNSEVLKGSVQDITDKKKAEIKLAESFKEKENILESIGDGFYSVDKHWTVTYWNRAAERLLYTSKQEILNQNLWDVFDDAIDLPLYTYYHRAMHQNIAVSFEDYYPPLEKWFDISAYPSPNGISVFFKDITERKTTEERIKRINERFEKVTEATNDAIWDFNVTANKLVWGKGFEKLFGYDLKKTEPSMDLLISLIHPDDRERVSQKIERYMGDKSKTNWSEEYRFLKNDDTYAYVMDRAIFIRNEKGKVIRIVGAMTDLTNQKKYEESLRKLNKELEERAQELAASNAELEQFAYVASHDLQEPLRMVTSFLTQLDKKYSDALDDKAKEYINFAVDGAQRMRQIILDLLNYSRLNQDKNKREKVDLNSILEEVQSLERSLIEEKKAEIEIQKLPVIVGNPGPIKQVFKNLLSNALKYCTNGTCPKIYIKFEDLDTHWKFSIEDNGIGINPEFQDTIFQIFQRLHTREQYSGTGIGLAISKKIIERHGGEIWVESKEGKGSTFYFTIEK